MAIFTPDHQGAGVQNPGWARGRALLTWMPRTPRGAIVKTGYDVNPLPWLTPGMYSCRTLDTPVGLENNFSVSSGEQIHPREVR
jgi:hypothetical protein